MPRKGLFITLVALMLLTMAVALGATFVAMDRATDRPGGFFLSFKPFTTGELLRLELEVDEDNLGREIQSPELELIKERTVEVRGLPLNEDVPFVELPQGAVRFLFLQELAEEMPAEEMEADEKLLVALGLFPDDQSLDEVLADVYGEQIAGTYDTDSKEITIVRGESGGGVSEQLTISHEIAHALQDQNFGLDAPPLENDDNNGDEDLAALSLIEGDAMLTMVLYAREHLTVADMRELATEDYDSEELDSAPLYIRRSILFPYEEGFEFVQALGTDGFDAVNRALRDPPLSTEQILHPARYIEKRDQPREVPVPDISGQLGEGWKKINEDCMGEFDVNVWFEQFFGEGGKPEVGPGWGGNTIQYYDGPKKTRLVVNSFAWDTARDAAEFYAAYEELIEARFGRGARKVAESQDAYLYQADGELFYCGIAGDATLCLQAPDRPTLDKALGELPGFPEAPMPGV